MIRALLTIDDVSSENTPAIVDYLCGKNIKVIMFMVGQWAENHPDELIYALKNGMIVGNHSKQAGVERRFRPFRFPYGDKGGDKKDLLQAFLRDNGFDKVNDKDLKYPWWSERGLDKDIDTFWTFDFAEYCIRKGSGFGLEDVMKRIYDKDPEDGAVLLKDNSSHILLLHAHDDTEELVPGYYKIFIEELLKNGVEFIDPSFI